MERAGAQRMNENPQKLGHTGLGHLLTGPGFSHITHKSSSDSRGVWTVPQNQCVGTVVAALN